MNQEVVKRCLKRALGAQAVVAAMKASVAAAQQSLERSVVEERRAMMELRQALDVPEWLSVREVLEEAANRLGRRYPV